MLDKDKPTVTNIVEWFSHHAPDEHQISSMQTIRQRARDVALALAVGDTDRPYTNDLFENLLHSILGLVPNGNDKDLAINSIMAAKKEDAPLSERVVFLRLATVLANAAIVLHEPTTKSLGSVKGSDASGERGSDGGSNT